MTEVWNRWEGQVVGGGYHLRQYLGGCEHSAVFLADFGGVESRKAAVKLVRVDSKEAELQLSRWERAAKLSHPHLVRLLETGRCGSASERLLFAVMERAEENLSEVLPERPLTAEEAGQMLEPVLNALAHLHTKGFVHARLKPANILVVDGQLKLSNDGVRKIGERPGPVWTPSPYDAPEIAGGAFTPAADVWSLGVSLVEALTQRLPGSERTQEELPPLFLEIARAALQRDPKRRATAEQLLARLRPAPAKPKRRHSLAVAAIVVALAIVPAGVLLHNRQPEAPLPRPAPPVKPVRPIPKPSPAPRSAPGRAVEPVLPDVPQKALDTIQGKVRVGVRVEVNQSGEVTNAELASPGPSKYFARLALEAAQRWKFEAPLEKGRPVDSAWQVRFLFRSTGTEYSVARASLRDQ
jgi:TonB family protein